MKTEFDWFQTDFADHITYIDYGNKIHFAITSYTFSFQICFECSYM